EAPRSEDRNTHSCRHLRQKNEGGYASAHMPTCLEALANDRISTSLLRQDCIFDAPHLVENQTSGIARACDNVGSRSPEKHHCVDARLEADAQFLLQQNRVGGEGDEIDAKWSGGHLSHRVDL